MVRTVINKIDSCIESVVVDRSGHQIQSVMKPKLNYKIRFLR